MLVGGVMSVVIVLSITIAGPQIGIVATTAFLIVGQFGLATAIDRLGWFGVAAGADRLGAADRAHPARSGRRTDAEAVTGRAWLALWTVYIVWGSTYLGIALAGETIPPVFAAGVRFLLAGALMGAFVALRRGRDPFRVRRDELGSAALVGVLLLGANALLFVAERHVPIGLASLLIASVPLWIVLMRTATGDRPSRVALVGVATGFAGIAILVRPTEAASLLGILLVLGSALVWATGSFLSSKLPLPEDPFVATTLEMLAGGALLLPIGLAFPGADSLDPIDVVVALARRARLPRPRSARSSATRPTCGCSPTSRSARSRRTRT